jgi:hypothetical protein
VTARTRPRVTKSGASGAGGADSRIATLPVIRAGVVFGRFLVGSVTPLVQPPLAADFRSFTSIANPSAEEVPHSTGS